MHLVAFNAGILFFRIHNNVSFGAGNKPNFDPGEIKNRPATLKAHNCSLPFVVQHLLDYFTFKAVRTVLAQLHEMNPSDYVWFYNFVVNKKPGDGKVFLRFLVKEKQELGERVMITRLHLFNKWVKKYNHANMQQAISDQNLELMRERLVDIVKWPSDNDIDTGKSD
eukprot:Gb_25794 [translate_table: standard]